MDDRKILFMLWNRDQSAIDAMQQQYGRRLYQTAMNILGSAQDAEETVNDTYLALWDAIPPEHPEPLEGYVHRTGRNIALNRLRYQSAKKRQSCYDIPLSELEAVLPEDDFQSRLEVRALGRAINAFLGTLSGKNRRLFLRRYWFGDSIPELAKSEVMTVGALSVRLSRLRQQLKQYLIQEGYLYEA